MERPLAQRKFPVQFFPGKTRRRRVDQLDHRRGDGFLFCFSGGVLVWKFHPAMPVFAGSGGSRRIHVPNFSGLIGDLALNQRFFFTHEHHSQPARVHYGFAGIPYLPAFEACGSAPEIWLSLVRRFTGGAGGFVPNEFSLHRWLLAFLCGQLHGPDAGPGPCSVPRSGEPGYGIFRKNQLFALTESPYHCLSAKPGLCRHRNFFQRARHVLPLLAGHHAVINGGICPDAPLY